LFLDWAAGRSTRHDTGKFDSWRKAKWSPGKLSFGSAVALALGSGYRLNIATLAELADGFLALQNLVRHHVSSVIHLIASP
jgi:hypothetical protein